MSWLAATIVVIVPILPHFLYRLSPGAPQALAGNIAGLASSSQSNEPVKPQTPLPPLNPSLPKTNRLAIPTIGVDGEIHTGDNWEQILEKGVWIVPGFGSPNDNQQPIILASHRWGYLDWSNSFRKLNSFYSLPKLQNGDQVQVIWEQRLYTYEIYKSESSTEITDYSADLILYTCQLWNSPVRIFRYAKRI